MLTTLRESTHAPRCNTLSSLLLLMKQKTRNANNQVFYDTHKKQVLCLAPTGAHCRSHRDKYLAAASEAVSSYAASLKQSCAGATVCQRNDLPASCMNGLSGNHILV